MITLHRLRPFLAALFIVLLTGCLTIEENYTFKKNGSGTMEYVVDMSEIGELMKTLGEMGEASGTTTNTDELGSLDMNDEMTALKGIQGISKVKLDARKKWVQRLKFNFKDVDALNAALNVLMPDSTGQPHRFFAWEGGTLVRTNNRHAYELGAGMAKSEAGEEGEEGADMSTFLASMKYKYSFKFADGVASTASAEGVHKVEEKKAVRLETDWDVISRDPQALDLRIQLNK